VRDETKRERERERERERLRERERDGDRFSGGLALVESEDTISGQSSGGGVESSPVEPKQTRL
jgi:hypothetical protein